jgi:hypothetical protein
LFLTHVCWLLCLYVIPVVKHAFVDQVYEGAHVAHSSSKGLLWDAARLLSLIVAFAQMNRSFRAYPPRSLVRAACSLYIYLFLSGMTLIHYKFLFILRTQYQHNGMFARLFIGIDVAVAVIY